MRQHSEITASPAERDATSYKSPQKKTRNVSAAPRELQDTTETTIATHQSSSLPETMRLSQEEQAFLSTIQMSRMSSAMSTIAEHPAAKGAEEEDESVGWGHSRLEDGSTNLQNETTAITAPHDDSYQVRPQQLPMSSHPASSRFSSSIQRTAPPTATGAVPMPTAHSEQSDNDNPPSSTDWSQYSAIDLDHALANSPSRRAFASMEEYQKIEARARQDQKQAAYQNENNKNYNNNYDNTHDHEEEDSGVVQGSVAVINPNPQFKEKGKEKEKEKEKVKRSTNARSSSRLSDSSRERGRVGSGKSSSQSSRRGKPSSMSSSQMSMSVRPSHRSDFLDMGEVEEQLHAMDQSVRKYELSHGKEMHASVTHSYGSFTDMTRAVLTTCGRLSEYVSSCQDELQQHVRSRRQLEEQLQELSARNAQLESEKEGMLQEMRHLKEVTESTSNSVTEQLQLFEKLLMTALKEQEIRNMADIFQELQHLQVSSAAPRHASNASNSNSSAWADDLSEQTQSGWSALRQDQIPQARTNPVPRQRRNVSASNMTNTSRPSHTTGPIVSSSGTVAPATSPTRISRVFPHSDFSTQPSHPSNLQVSSAQSSVAARALTWSAANPEVRGPGLLQNR